MTAQIEARDYTQGAKKSALDAQTFAPLQKFFQQLIEGNQQKDLLAQKGQQEATAEQGRQEQGLALLQKLKADPQFAGLINDGGSVNVDPATGSIHAGGNPYAKLAAQGPHEAKAFLDKAQGAYKSINDQLDASKATIDNLNLGNSTGDKLALLNEAKLALAGSGGRAFGAVMAQLSGDPSMAQDSQKAWNWIQNTPNAPTMQSGQRDAIRESVFARGGQLKQQHKQITDQLGQWGPALAPHADYTSLAQSVVAPVQQKLDQMDQMQGQYQQSRTQMAPQPNVSNPSVADQNPTTVDRLKGFLGMGGQPAKQPQPQGTPPGAMGSPPQSKQITKKQYSKSLNQTRIIYNDGSADTVDGLQQ